MNEMTGPSDEAGDLAQYRVTPQRPSAGSPRWWMTITALLFNVRPAGRPLRTSNWAGGHKRGLLTCLLRIGVFVD
jgi:hypothetical protein